MNDNESLSIIPESEIVTSHQVLTEDGSLIIGNLPLDLGLSKLLNSSDSEVVMADGTVITLTGEDNDFLAVTDDFNFRDRQILANVYCSGTNLLRLRDFMTKTYDYSEKDFWDRATKLTKYKRTSLDNRMKIAAGYSKEEMKLLMESGATQSGALRMLRAAPEKRAEVLQEAREGLQVNKAVLDEMLGKDEDFEDEDTDTSDTDTEAKEETETSLFDSKKPSTAKAANSASTNAALPNKTAKSVKPVLPDKSASNAIVDVQGSFRSYTESTDTKDYTPQYIALEQRFNLVAAEIEIARTKYELTTVRGLAVRCAMTMVQAAIYGITLPSKVEAKNEPEWVKEMRDLLPEKQNREFSSKFLMPFVEGHLDAMKGETTAPFAYDLLKKSMSEKAVSCLYEFWQRGFAQQQLIIKEATKADS